jgi:hypothetical protein
MSPPRKPLPPVPVTTDVLTSPEVILRVKRRVGPAFWGPVAIVLQCARDALEEGLDKPDRWAPEEMAKLKKAPKKLPEMSTYQALKKFVTGGICCPSHRDQLKHKNLITYDHATWHLTDKGREEAKRFGLL